ncbi:hypothetical protein [Bradyrhizobium sacchari]|uniref:Uncharacterized protein n=1 Tax=Bradyrhizobium sacchari TaxID=1399419 RepID=A0A560KCZ1_9BRAD|nr:hypothetical protein [Bradyrhizobium sacchari]TWB80869.1 hypothetical protein FBZ95_10286 [Bradyrhizobium sacchari]
MATSFLLITYGKTAALGKNQSTLNATRVSGVELIRSAQSRQVHYTCRGLEETFKCLQALNAQTVLARPLLLRCGNTELGRVHSDTKMSATLLPLKTLSPHF